MSAGNRLIHCSAQSMTHNECAGYAQFSIKQKTTSNGLQADLNHNSTADLWESVTLR